jgi:hypothetical protein
MIRKIVCFMTLASGLVIGSVRLSAADDSPLLNTLVRKGVLSDKEAADIQAEAIKETAGVTAGKIVVGDWVKELKFSGDLRIRNQWDERTPIIVGNPNSKTLDSDIPRDRWRFRLRLNADF